MRISRFKNLIVFLVGALCLLANALANTTFSISPLPPPSVLYRVDGRPPTEIFRDGFLSYAQSSGSMPDNDLLRHVQGASPIAPISARTNWISTSQDPDFPLHWMALHAFGDEPPQYLYTYHIQPAANAYSVNWGIMEYILRAPAGQEARIAIMESVYDAYNYQREWAFQERIRPQDIASVNRYVFNPDRLEYIFDRTENNPNFVRTDYNAPATSNPFEVYAGGPIVNEEIFAYSPPVSRRASENGTLIELLDWASSCGYWGPPASSRSSSSPANNTAISCKLDRVKKYSPNTVSYPSKLHLTVDGNEYCLTPTSSSGYVSARFSACTQDSVRFEYDVYRRLYVNWQNNAWCMTAPKGVVDASSPTWDYVRFEPCAVNSKYQKWRIGNGFIKSYAGALSLQFHRQYAVLSGRNDFTSAKISKIKMEPNFFAGLSPSKSNQVELEMGWVWGGGKYYSNFNTTSPWSTSYWNRSYYDYDKRTISYIDPSSAFAKYCLQSKQHRSQSRTWEWTKWARCNDNDIATPTEFQWTIKSMKDAISNPSAVEWWDASKDALWVEAKNNQNAGFYFTAYSAALDYSSTAVRKFSVRPDALLIGRRFKAN